MITQQDLEQAISDCMGQHNPNANTCIKLAAFLTIQRELFGEDKQAEQLPYSFSPEPDGKISFDSGSEFSRIINGQDQRQVFHVIDDLMDAVKVLQPNLYNATLNKLTTI